LRIFQVRLHGRGGQGAVTTAELLSVAAFSEGKHAQAFPSFGSERMGAPVMAFCRIDDKPIRIREPVTHPDALIIGDPTLLHQVEVFSGLRPGSFMLINAAGAFEDLGLGEYIRPMRAGLLLVVLASRMAQQHLGQAAAWRRAARRLRRPDRPGTAGLGSRGDQGAVPWDGRRRQRRGATEAFEFVQAEQEELADA